MTEIRKRIMKADVTPSSDPLFVEKPRFMYWDTGIVPYTWQRWELDFELTASTLGSIGVYFLSSRAVTNTEYMGLRKGTSTGYVNMPMAYTMTTSRTTQTVYIDEMTYELNTRYLLSLRGYRQGTTNNTSVIFKCNDYQETEGFSGLNTTNNCPLYLGALNDRNISAVRSTAMGDAKIYGCRIYDEDDTTLLLNLVPKWNANGEAQLYDTVQDRWVEWTEAV